MRQSDLYETRRFTPDVQFMLVVVQPIYGREHFSNCLVLAGIIAWALVESIRHMHCTLYCTAAPQTTLLYLGVSYLTGSMECLSLKRLRLLALALVMADYRGKAQLGPGLHGKGA